MRRTQIVFLFAAFAFLCPASRVAWAGVCLDSVDWYLECVENRASCKTHNYSVDEALSCVAMTARELFYDWATHTQVQVYARYRKSPKRDRIRVALEPLLDSAEVSDYGSYKRSFRAQAASILATYGYDKIGNHDLFEILVSEDPTIPLYALGALGDSRILPYLRKWSSDPAWSKDVSARAGIANCLYHIRGGAAVELAKELLARERDKEVRARLKRIVERK